MADRDLHARRARLDPPLDLHAPAETQPELVQKPRAYLCSIASNLVREFRLRTAREQEQLIFDSEAVDDAAEQPSQAVQDYLKAIHRLGGVDRVVSPVDIANCLQVKAPSVTGMLKRLKEAGWISYEPGSGAKLTAEGIQEARRVIRRHRLVELFLHRVLSELPADKQQMLDRLHRSDDDLVGKKVLVVVGGAGTQAGFELATKTADTVGIFIHNIKLFVDKYNYDGVDIDWEPLKSGTVDTAQYPNLISRLRVMSSIVCKIFLEGRDRLSHPRFV